MPWRTALPELAALPALVRGPVDRLALLRLAATCAAEGARGLPPSSVASLPDGGGREGFSRSAGSAWSPLRVGDRARCICSDRCRSESPVLWADGSGVIRRRLDWSQHVLYFLLRSRAPELCHHLLLRTSGYLDSGLVTTLRPVGRASIRRRGVMIGNTQEGWVLSPSPLECHARGGALCGPRWPRVLWRGDVDFLLPICVLRAIHNEPVVGSTDNPANLIQQGLLRYLFRYRSTYSGHVQRRGV